MCSKLGMHNFCFMLEANCFFDGIPNGDTARRTTKKKSRGLLDQFPGQIQQDLAWKGIISRTLHLIIYVMDCFVLW